MTVASAVGVGVGRCFFGILALSALVAAAAEPALGGAGSAQTGATKSFGSRVSSWEDSRRCTRCGRSVAARHGSALDAGGGSLDGVELTFEDLDDDFEEARRFAFFTEASALAFCHAETFD